MTTNHVLIRGRRRCRWLSPLRLCHPPPHPYNVEGSSTSSSLEYAALTNTATRLDCLNTTMTGCTQSCTDWVRISTADVSSASQKLLLDDPKRLNRLVEGMRTPACIFPQVVLCVGEVNTQSLAPCLFPKRHSSRELPVSSLPSTSSQSLSSRTLPPSPTSRPDAGMISDIHVDESQKATPNPVYLADYRLSTSVSRAKWCNPLTVRRHRIEWSNLQQNINETVLSRLVFPFSDLIYLFANDLGGIDRVADRIEAWSAAARATDLPLKALPRVCVVTFGPVTAASQLQAEAFDARLKKIRYHHQFANIQLLRFDDMSSPQWDENIRRVTRDELKIVSEAKKEAKVQFNAIHMAEFFSQATAHLSRTTSEPFSYIQASRAYRSVPTTYRDQIHILISICMKEGIEPYIYNRLTASCLLLDAYPRACHGDCEPHCEVVVKCC